MQTILLVLAVVIILILLTKLGRETIVGICKGALEQTIRKNANKQKILDFLSREEDKDEVSNHDIGMHLGVSPRTVVRYMDELEKEGKVRQVGSTGRAVLYRLV